MINGFSPVQLQVLGLLEVLEGDEGFGTLALFTEFVRVHPDCCKRTCAPDPRDAIPGIT